jgi:hypothetical protein
MNDIVDQSTQVAEQEPGQQLDYVLMDASGSMSGRWDPSMQAVDSYVAGLTANAVSTKVIMATFCDSHGFQYRRVREAPVAEWPQVYLDDAIEQSGGYTPLYDAINEMGLEIRNLNPTKCSILIVTDGEENTSKTTLVQAKAILNWLRRRGYQITFLGCDFENSIQAKALGASPQDFIGLTKERLAEAKALLAQKRHYYDKYGKPMGFDETEKKNLGGFLPDLSNGAQS